MVQSPLRHFFDEIALAPPTKRLEYDMCPKNRVPVHHTVLALDLHAEELQSHDLLHFYIAIRQALARHSQES